MKKFDGIVEEATESELANAVGKANRTGLLCCPHTGVALAVVEKLAARGVLKSHERVIVISTANGLKFTDFLYKFHAHKLRGIDSEYQFESIELPPDYDIVRGKILEKLSS